jgi:hypothetical protein
VYHSEEVIEESIRNKYFCKVQFGPQDSSKLCPPMPLNLRHRTDWLCICFNNIRQRYSAIVQFGGMAGQGFLCMQLSHLNHREEVIEEGSRNKYLCMV